MPMLDQFDAYQSTSIGKPEPGKVKKDLLIAHDLTCPAPSIDSPTHSSQSCDLCGEGGDTFWKRQLEAGPDDTFPQLPDTRQEARPSLHIDNTFQVEWATSPIAARYHSLAALSLLLSTFCKSRETYIWLNSTPSRPLSSLAKDCSRAAYVYPLRIEYDSKLSVTQYCALVKEREVSAAGQNTLRIPLAPCCLNFWSNRTPRSLVSIYEHECHQTQEELSYSDPKSTDVDVALHFQIFISDLDVRTRFSFDAQVLHHEEVQRLVLNFEHIVRQLVSDRDTAIPKISMINAREFAVMQSWNASMAPKSNLTIHSVFGAYAQKNPSKQAVCSWDGNLTYAELDMLSTNLALSLQAQGVKSGVRVPVFLGKSRLVAVAALAVLKAGAAFVLMDCTHPRSRLELVINEIKPKLVLSSHQHEQLARSMHSVAMVIEDFLLRDVIATTCEMSMSNTLPTDTAYLVFTSGSTGVPKGVIMSHSAFCTSALAHGPALHMDSESRVLAFASNAFDVTMTEVLTTLMLGATVCFPQDDERNTLIVRTIEKMRVNWISWTPTFANLIKPSEMPLLKTLVVCGESPSSSLVALWKSNPRTTLINAYGPSECAVHTSSNTVLTQSKSVKNIGYPVGTAFWIVDPMDVERLLPIGAPGELLIAGHTLADGYLNNSRKTTSAFIDVPSWLQGYQGRLYRTGDLVRYESTGEVIYMGRIDTQVKISGQRIELGEVEVGLSLCFPEDCKEEIEVAVETCVKSGGGLRLVAFLSKRRPSTLWDGRGDVLTSAEDRAWTKRYAQKIKENSGSSLTTAMRPFAYIPLNAMPIAPTGKLDRARLRTIAASLEPEDFDAFLAEDDFNVDGESLTPNEQNLAQLWSSAIGISSRRLVASSNFFTKGGDSIAAMRLVKLLNDKGLNLSVKDIFEYPLLGDQAPKVGTLVRESHTSIAFDSLPESEDWSRLLTSASGQCEIPVEMIEDMYPCSPLQEGLFVLSLTNPGAYVSRWIFEIPTNVNRGTLKQVWESLFLSESILRTRIVESNSGRLMQVVLAETLQWSSFSNLKEYLDEKSSRLPHPGSPLVQFAMGPEHFNIIMHHALYDGHSLRLLFERAKEVMTECAPSIAHPFKKFVRYCMSMDRVAAAAFWTGTLRECPSSTFPALPHGRHPVTDNFLQQNVTFRALNSGITKSIFLRAAFALLLMKYENATDVCFGTTLSGRNAAVDGVSEMIGPTITTVPVRVSLRDGESVGQFLKTLQTQFTTMIPFEQYGLQNISRLNADTAVGCGFRSLLVIQPEQIDEDFLGTGLGLCSCNAEAELEKHALPFVLESTMTPRGASVSAWYDSHILEQVQVQRFIGQYEKLLQQLCEVSADSIAKDIQAFNAADLEVLRIWNSQLPATKEDTIHQLINERSLLYPESIALCSTSSSFTYQQINDLSDRVASFLISKHQHHRFVPILFDKNPFAIISMLGILKAGGAFVPLDPRYPSSRLRMILNEIKARVVLCSNSCIPLAESVCQDAIAVDYDAKALLYSEKTDLDDVQGLAVQSTAPAYVIFTSGTTGRPKGVVVQHQAFCSTIIHKARVYRRTSQSRVLSFASYAFDNCLDEELLTLAVGGTVCIPTEDEKMNDLVSFMNRMQVNAADIPQSVANLYKPRDLPFVKVFIMGGEAMSKATIEQWGGAVDLINAYGPTEASVTSVAEMKLQNSRSARIGYAVGCRVWIVDPDNRQQLAALGSIGELLLEGPNLAQCYLNDSVKTASSFIYCPDWAHNFFPPVSRLYCTGDLCAYDSDGCVMFFGRKDQQIKLRGQRIELGEIENALQKCLPEGVTAVAETITTKGSENSLIAAFICLKYDGECEPSLLLASTNFSSLTAVVNEELPKCIPAYMQPSVLIHVSSIPKTVSGKVDRRTLKNMALQFTLEEIKTLSEKTYNDQRMPETETEHRIARLFATALGLEVDRIYRQASFFQLGGNSIDIMRLIALSREQNIEITSRDVLENPALDALAKFVEKRSATAAQMIGPDTKFLLQKDLAQHNELQRVVEVGQRTTLQRHKKSIDNLVNDLQIRQTKSDASKNTGNENHTVILTGSSGALGSHLLEVLLKDPSVYHLYCLDRAPSLSSTRSDRNRRRNLTNHDSSYRVTFLTADISQPNFGLGHETYNNLLNRVTAIIHSAWPVNFNLPLSAFDSQLIGITRLVEFAVNTIHSSILFFVSSTDSVLGYYGNVPLIREEIILDSKPPSSIGYEESKYLAELLLDYASKRLFITARIARVGQIAGPVKGQGIWNEWEWLPSLVLSSLHVGAIPDSLGASQDKIDWVPVDLLAEVLVELALKTEKSDNVQVFHPLNPRPVAWKSLLPHIVRALDHSVVTAKQIDTVPFQLWLDKVRGDAEAANSTNVEAMLSLNPAAKLLQVYTKFAENDQDLEFETLKTKEASSKMRAIEGIKPAWLERWVRAWLAIGKEAPQVLD